LSPTVICTKITTLLVQRIVFFNSFYLKMHQNSVQLTPMQHITRSSVGMEEGDRM